MSLAERTERLGKLWDVDCGMWTVGCGPGGEKKTEGVGLSGVGAAANFGVIGGEEGNAHFSSFSKHPNVVRIFHRAK